MSTLNTAVRANGKCQRKEIRQTKKTVPIYLCHVKGQHMPNMSKIVSLFLSTTPMPVHTKILLPVTFCSVISDCKLRIPKHFFLGGGESKAMFRMYSCGTYSACRRPGFDPQCYNFLSTVSGVASDQCQV